jgi:hypothetical protein
MLPPLLQTASLRKTRSPALQNPRASGSRSAAGRRAKRTSGFALAAVNGTRSILEACAQPACTSGLKHNVSRAADGRHIPNGIATRD